MLTSLSLIETGTRLRGIDADQVSALANSIAEVGLICPIAVYAREVIRANIAVPGFGLIAGLHRLEAVRSLGLTGIEANVIEIGDLDRQIAECDENLCGTKLTPAERAMFTARRKDAYEAKHPETRHGAVGRGGKSSQLENSFAEDTAAKTGQGRSTVARDATRGDRIADDVLDQIRGTDLDRGTILDEIASAPRDQQAAKVHEIAERRASKQAEPRAEQVLRPKHVMPREGELDTDEADQSHETQKIKEPEETEDEWRDYMMRGWNRAPEDWRDRFFQHALDQVSEQNEAYG